MKLTDEQEKILDCKDDMIIEAKAGCGKTSTLIQYGLRYPEKKKVYLAFNSSIKTEADEKFKKAGVKNITCTTVHSLGHTYAIKSGKFKLGYNPTAYHISKLFGLTDRKDQAVITYSIRLFETFCFSNFNSIEELNYQDYLVTDKAKDFFLDNKKPIEGFGKMIWDNMINKKLDCSHSFYLKYYQLSKPKLNYDILLFDEAADSDQVMLDIFYNQAGQKIMVGDSHQAIYAWRGAINSLASAPEHFKKFYLTNSFRFPQSIADLGVSVLMNKFSLNPLLDENLEINGKGFKSKIETRAIISRSNLALLDTLFSEKFAYRKPFIEGGIENLINTNSGVSILDLYYLSVGKKSEIKNAFVKGFKSIEDMKQYYEELDDTSINSGINFIRKYGGNLMFELEELKERIVDKESLADYTFSTIHKAKGKEWDEVTLLAPDVWDEGFPTSIPDRILKNIKASGESTYEILTEDKKKILLKKWIEELNIYYVGITRARVKINHDLVWLEQQKETNGISDEQFEQQLEIEGKPNTEEQTETFFKSNPDLSFTHNENRIDFKYKSVSGRINSFSISKDDLIDMCKKIFENGFII